MMEGAAEANGSEKPSATVTAPATDGVKVEPVKEEVKTERPAEKGEGGGKKPNDRDRGKSRDRQFERERQRRGERNRGDRGKGGSIYKPRTRPECRVYISNFPFDMRWQDLKDLFRSEVGEVSFVELFEDESGKPRGCGIIEFERLEHARLALEKMHRYELKGRKLVVKEDFDVERDAHGRVVGGVPPSRRDSRDDFRGPPRDYRDVGRAGGPGGMGVGKTGGGMGSGGAGGGSGGILGTLACPSSTQWSNTYGLSPQFLDSLGISGLLYNRVFVANLDYKVDDAKLREVFRLAGKVITAEVTKDKDGKSRGFGVVEMDHPVEAVQAISMFNNQMLYDRRMTVRMDREVDRGEARPPKLPEGLRSIGLGLGAGGNPLHDVSRVSTSGSMGSRGYSGSNMGMSSDMGLGSTTSGMGPMSGVSRMPVGGLQGMGSSSSLQGMPSSDLMRGSVSSSYGMSGSGSNGSMAMGSISGLNSSSYGYSTDSMTSRGPSMGSVSDYDRRDTYDGYRTMPQSDRDRQEYRTSSYDLGTRMGSMGHSSMSSMPSSNMGHPGGNMRVSDSIVVNNLPINCTWQDLRDKFCEVGDVLFADISAKGTGIVRFSSERDAQRACSMLNGTLMEGRSIEVDFY